MGLAPARMQGRAGPAERGTVTRLLVLALGSACLAWAPLARAQAAEQQGTITIELYSREGCPHCARADRFLSALERRRSDIVLRRHDVLREPEALQRLRDLVQASGASQAAVPAIYVRDRLFIGFASEETTGREVEAVVGPGPLPTGSRAPPSDGSLAETSPHGASGASRVRVPLLGALDARELGLPIFTLAVGLVDGFNPCAMWVLLFVLSMLVHLQSRARMALIGGAFVLVSGLVYFAFMAAWLNFFVLVGVSRPLQLVLGALAIGMGAIHVKDFFALKRGVSLSIPESAKPGIYRRVRRVLQAEHLWGAFFAVVVLAAMVNVVELLCTAGLPALYTQVLTSQGVSPRARYGYLALYNVVYMLDDALMVGIAVVTLSHRKLQERGARWLKLISGTLMGVLGLLLVFRPAWLSWT